ncbi:hypothetical protein [Pendulispora albinea]|uniref:Uncharacterized protein n=1 Tax=Pendulispora albinea TaxID=2741071 RepID=A0ABZ2LQ90_9BACT
MRARRGAVRNGLLAIGFAASISVVSSPARAQNKVEQQARTLQKKAIEEDYLSTEFSKAEDRLNKAINLCGPASGESKCSAQLRAQLRRDLGVVQIGGQIDREKGIANFAEALRIDPNVALDPDTRTSDLEQAFDTAKRKAGIAVSAPPGASPASGPSGAGPQPLPRELVPPPPPQAKPGAGSDSSDCPPGAPCDTKAGSQPAFPRVWIGAGLGFEFLQLPAGDDVCKLNGEGSNKYAPKNDKGYYCTTPDGSDYPTRSDPALRDNQKLVEGKAGKVESGLLPANLRVWLSFDYALSANFLLGARLGLVLRTYPGSEPKKDGHVTLAPFHLEARLTYLIGKNAITQTVAPYVFVASGASQFDAKVEVPVRENDAPAPRTVHAWEIAGPWFVALGAGARITFGERKNLALLLGARGNLTMPVAKSQVVPSFGPEANFQVGF